MTDFVICDHAGDPRCPGKEANCPLMTPHAPHSLPEFEQTNLCLYARGKDVHGRDVPKYLAVKCIPFGAYVVETINMAKTATFWSSIVVGIAVGFIIMFLISLLS